MLNNKRANISVYNELGKMDKRLIDVIYIPYIKELFDIRNWIKNKYGHEIKVYGQKKFERMVFRNVRDAVTYVLVCLNILYRGKRNIIEID